jgi:hypothetical protein
MWVAHRVNYRPFITQNLVVISFRAEEENHRVVTARSGRATRAPDEQKDCMEDSAYFTEGDASWDSELVDLQGVH